MDGGRPTAPSTAHRSGLVLHIPGRVPLDASRDHLRVSVPSNHVRDRILTRYLPLVTDALDEIVVQPGCNFEVLVDPAMTPDADRLESTAATGVDVACRSTCRTTTRGARRPRPLNGDFERRCHSTRPGSTRATPSRRFVKGASNQFALAAALRVAETPGALVQPAVHLRRGRARQDPPAARHRALRPPQLPAPRGALRLHRDVPQRVRRRHPHQHHGGVQAPLPRHRRAAHRRHPVPREPGGAAGGVLPHVQLAARGEQADRHLQSIACPTPSPRWRSGCAAGSSGG